ncbi:hypothetical protein [Vibrio cortegadensis]|uniref:hypothetical protein n=1 Tax=Vibrio cortegadensis TaxID=1328770 RepID=UPI00352C0C90
MKTIHLGTYEDSIGEKHEVIQRIRQIRSKRLATGTDEYFDGPMDWITSNGIHLNINEDGTFSTLSGNVLNPLY